MGRTESYDPVVLVDPASLPESASVLNALARGTERHRLRSLDIACPGDHRLLEVFGIGDRAVLLAHGRVRYADGWRDGLGAACLRDLQRPTLTAAIAVRVQCRCQTALIPITGITRMLHLGMRRVVWQWGRVRPRSARR